MGDMIGYADSVGYRVRRDAYHSKVVVWEGYGSVGMSLYYGPHQLISLATTRVDPTEATTHGLPVFVPISTLHKSS